MVRVEVPEPPAVRVRLAGLNEHTAPDVEVEADKVMSPARALRLVSATNDVPLAPCTIVSEDGLAETPKSGVIDREVMSFIQVPAEPLDQYIHPTVPKLRKTVAALVFHCSLMSPGELP